MRIRLLTLAASALLMAGAATTAYAGNCGQGSYGSNCAPQVISHPGKYMAPAPVHVYNSAPFDYLKTFEYKNTPDVNITRVHSMQSTAGTGLADHPSAFGSDGCNPVSTMYCRGSGMPATGGTPVNVTLYGNAGNSSTATTTMATSGKMYGSLDFVPGIAHVPTSIVDRSPITHIDGIPQPQAHSVTTLGSSSHTISGTVNNNTAQMAGPVVGPMPMYPQITPPASNGQFLGHVITGEHTYQPPGGGAYWEKTSGPTIVDGLPATQILCRRAAPKPNPIRVRTVSPVYGVPQPVHVPAPVMCGPVPMPVMPHAQWGPGPMPPQMAPSRWTY